LRHPVSGRPAIRIHRERIRRTRQRPRAARQLLLPQLPPARHVVVDALRGRRRARRARIIALPISAHGSCGPASTWHEAAIAKGSQTTMSISGQCSTPEARADGSQVPADAFSKNERNDALKKAMSEYGLRIHAFCYRMVHNQALAEDVLQQTFEKAFCDWA